jgi:hypothetical protein
LKCRKHRIRADLDLAGQSREDMLPPLRQILDTRGQTGRVQAQAQDVHRWLKKLRRRSGEQRRKGAVGRHKVPMPVNGERGIGLVSLEHEIDGLACGLQGRIVQTVFGIDRRVAGRNQKRVALAQRDVELLRQMDQHRPARQ